MASSLPASLDAPSHAPRTLPGLASSGQRSRTADIRLDLAVPVVASLLGSGRAGTEEGVNADSGPVPATLDAIPSNVAVVRPVRYFRACLVGGMIALSLGLAFGCLGCFGLRTSRPPLFFAMTHSWAW